jgi:hypothetical protein
MKTYEVEVKRVTYITYRVDAEDKADAQLQAMERADEDYGPADNYANLVTEIEE